MMEGRFWGSAYVTYCGFHVGRDRDGGHTTYGRREGPGSQDYTIESLPENFQTGSG